MSSVKVTASGAEDWQPNLFDHYLDTIFVLLAFSLLPKVIGHTNTAFLPLHALPKVATLNSSIYYEAQETSNDCTSCSISLLRSGDYSDRKENRWGCDRSSSWPTRSALELGLQRPVDDQIDFIVARVSVLVDTAHPYSY